MVFLVLCSFQDLQNLFDADINSWVFDAKCLTGAFGKTNLVYVTRVDPGYGGEISN